MKFVLVCLLDDLILGFCYSNFETGNRWTRTRIDYHPSITSRYESDRGNNGELTILETNSVPKIVIFDGMALVNRIKKDVQITTCKDLAETSTRVVHHESEGYDEVRLIFDHYQENLMKGQTKNNRAQGNQTRYKINDTNLHGVTMTKLLLHMLTKQDLTGFLGNHLEQHFSLIRRNIFFQTKISYGRKFLRAQICTAFIFAIFPQKRKNK